jgi:phage-related protein
VGLLGDLENRLLKAVADFFKPVISPVLKLWKLIKDFFTALIDLIPETIALVQLIISEVKAWKSFRENINFKTGVMNLQSAKDRILQLIDEIKQGWNSLQDLFTSGFKLPIKSVNEAVDALTEVVTAFEDFFGKTGLEVALKRLGSTLEKAGGKVFEVLAIIQAVAEEALKVVREVHDIVQALKDIRETFQTGEGLFLSQKNSRKVVKLEDGTSMRIRVGNLHDA